MNITVITGSAHRSGTSALQGNKKTALLLSMADNTTESAEASGIFFKHFADFMSWENLGIISATNSWTHADMEKTDFPQKAYELGKSL